MEKIKNLSSYVEKILKLAYWVLIACSSIVVVVFGAVAFIPALSQVATEGTWTLGLGNVDLKLAQGIVNFEQIRVEMIFTMVFLVVFTGFICYGIKIIRNIMNPMSQGQPFDGTVSGNLKKLSMVFIYGGIVLGVIGCVGNAFVFEAFNINNLLLSDKIVSINVTNELVDIKTVFLGLIIYLLSYVFAYGEKLQQQEDETL